MIWIKNQDRLKKLLHYECVISQIKDEILFSSQYFLENKDDIYMLGLYDGIEYVISKLDNREPNFIKDLEPFKSRLKVKESVDLTNLIKKFEDDLE